MQRYVEAPVTALETPSRRVLCRRACARSRRSCPRRCERIAQQIAKRLAGERIENRLVSLADLDARPIRKGKRGKPTESGYVTQLCELTQPSAPSSLAAKSLPLRTLAASSLARYRTGAEGRISHLKRGYGLGRSRLKGQGRVMPSGPGGRCSPTTLTPLPSWAPKKLIGLERATTH